MASETTPLTSGEESRTYLFLSQRHRNRRTKIQQFQCCVCAAMLGIFVTAMVITVSYSMNHDPDDDLTDNGTNTQVLLPAPANKAALQTLLSLNWPRPDILPPDWPAPIPTDAQITAALESGEMSLKNKDDLEARAALKTDDPSSPAILTLGSPSYIHQEATKTYSTATNAARAGYVIGKATEMLMKGKSVKPSVGKGPQVNPSWIPAGMNCKTKSLQRGVYYPSATCPPSRYRTMDGTCNNLEHPDWGVAMQPLRRVIPPDYGDGVSSPRVAKDGSKLPSARDVSLTVHRPIYRNDPHFTVMLAVWGQFFDHDMTATALSKSKGGTPISCCTADGKVATENVHPECYPVILSPEDPYYSDYGMTCMNFVRSAPSPTCNLGPREQLNQITSFIDGSVVYGSSVEQAKHLRSTNKKGELDMMITPDGRELLPPSTDPKDGCNKPEMNANGKYCFKSGDSRANENLHLTSMHLLMAREHNRIVRAISKMNPTWTDEQLYQEGRRIVSAQMQHITYKEFLPVVLGQSMMDRLKLAPLESGYTRDYDPEVNPAVANIVATAAFRFAHTLLPTLMKILKNDSSSEEYVELHKILFNPYALYNQGQMVGTLKGALDTVVQRVDTYITPEVTQHLFQQKWSEEFDMAMNKGGSFKGKKKGYGLDLASLNVQRGRDHGLPSYSAWREHCGMSRPQSFSDLNGEMDEAALERLASLYRSVDDVDVYSGSLSEIPTGEGLLGPTFSCLISDQFLRLKNGDRYWYETAELPQAFTPEQLAEIRRATLASIICENSGVDRVQQWVMQAVDDENPRMMCDYIPRLRLEAWRDKSMVGRVSLSPSPIYVKAIPRMSEEPASTSETASSSFIKGTVTSASITATGSDGTAIVAMQPSTTFPVTIPVHLFDQKIPVTSSMTPDFAEGILPPFYHGGGGVTWTGSLTSPDPTKAHLTGSFSVPVFKHAATAFDFVMTTYTGSFDIYLNLSPSNSPLGVPTLQGTYNSGIYFKTEVPAMVNSQLSMTEVKKLMEEPVNGGPKLPMAPVLLYGTYSLDHSEFYWDGNISIIIPPPIMPKVTASGGGTIKSKMSTQIDVSAVWGLVRAKAGPPPNPASANSKTVITTWWDGTLPVAIPQPAFDRTIMGVSPASASNKDADPGGGVTWSGSLTPVDGSDDVQFNGTFSFPVFLHGTSTLGFTLHIWQGDFSIILRSSSAPGAIPLATSLRFLGSGQKYKSPVYFRAGPQEMTLPDDTSDVSNLTIPVILHGFTSIDKSIFYWNGNASVILPQVASDVLMAQGRGNIGHGGGKTIYDSYEFDRRNYRLQATGGSPVEPLILTITSASVIMESTLNTNATGQNITWNGKFPVTLPQSPFYRRDKLTMSNSDIDIDPPYSPLAAPASSTKPSYKSEILWSNLSTKLINSTTDFQINGSLSFPVYHFPSVTAGPWPGPTIEKWKGNFSVIVNVNSTTGSAVSVNNILTLINLGDFTSSIYFIEESEAKESGNLAAEMGIDDSSTTPLLKVIMLLHGIKSVDKTEFYWNGVTTLIIRGLPTVAPLSYVQSIRSGKNPINPTEGSYLSGRIATGNIMSQSKNGGVYWWSGTLPLAIAMPAFDTVSPNAGVFTWPFEPTVYNGTGGLTWSGTMSRTASDKNRIAVKGGFTVPVFNHGNPSAFSVDEWNGFFELEINLFNDSPIIDSFPSTVYNSQLIFHERKSVSQGEDGSDVDTVSKIQNILNIVNSLSKSGDVQASQPRAPIILWGKYSADKLIFYWEGNISVILPTTPKPILTSMNKIQADTEPEVAPPSNNVKLPFKILTGRLSVTSPIFGKKILWDGKIPFTTLRSYFNGYSANTSYIGGSMKWSGRIMRSTSVVNGAHIEGTYSLPVFVHSNGGVVAETMTGDLSLSISFTGTQNIVDWAPNEGTYSSIITIAPGKPSVQLSLQNDQSPLMNMAIDNLMKSMNDEISNEDSNVVMVLPACFFGDYDPLHFTFSGDGITIVPANVSALLKTKHENKGWNSNSQSHMGGPISAPEEPNSMKPSDTEPEVAPPSNNVKLPFKILTGRLSVTSPIFGKKILWDGKIPFTTLRSYFNGYSANTSYIGGSMKWSGRIMRSTSVVNGAHIEGTYSLPVFVHSNGGVVAETMTGDLSLSISFTGTQNIVDWAPNEGTYSSIITIAPGKPSVQLSLQNDQSPLMNMAIDNLMKSMNDEISNEDSNVVMVLPACFFGDYDPLHFTFSGDGITIVPANVSALLKKKHENTGWNSNSQSHMGGPISVPAEPNSMKPSDTEPEVAPPSNNVKLPFKILTGRLSVTSPIFGTKILWDGKIPFTTLRSYFNGYSANTSYIGGSMKWSGRIMRSTSVVNGAHIEGTYSLPVFVHSNGGVVAETMTGDLSLSISFTGTQNIVDWAPNEGTYSSIITIAPGKPSVQLSLQNDQSPLMNMAIDNLMKSMNDEISNEDSNVVMVLPACFFGDYDPLHFTFSGDGITIVPANVSALLKKHESSEHYATSKNRNNLPRSLRQIPLESLHQTSTQSRNVKLPFKIISGSLTLGEEVLWDGKIPFTALRSYFNSYSENTSFIGGPMRWTGHTSRSSTLENGAHIEGSFSVPVFVHSNDTLSVEFWTGDLSFQVSFSGTQNIVDLIPNEGNFSSLINIAPIDPDVELSLKEAQNVHKNNFLLNMALNDLMNSIEIESAETDPDASIFMPLCFFGYLDDEKVIFNGDAIAIIPSNLAPSLSLEYESIVQDMSPTTKLQLGAASPYISGMVTSGNVMGISKSGGYFWWSGSLPLPIAMPPFDSISPNAGVFNWPYDPTFYNGTGGVTWSGAMSTTTSVKGGLSVKGQFTVPVFNHGNPSAFSVDEWNGDFELEMSIFYNNTAIGSLFPTGTYNSPLLFREHKTSGPRDTSGYDLEAIQEVENMMILSTNFGASGSVHAAMPRVPVILWGNYSIDKTVFYWEGNITVIFPPIQSNLYTALNQIASKNSEDTLGDKRLRLPMKILTGNITSTSPVFGEKILWDGTIPFTTLQSYFSKYSTNSSFIGGPVQWTGKISSSTAMENGAQIEGSFAVPIIVPLNKNESFMYLTGDFTFVVSFNGTQNIVDLMPNSGKYASLIILGVSHDELESYMVESADDEPYMQNDKNKQLKMQMKQLAEDPGTSLSTFFPIIFLGDYGSKNFTFNGEAIVIIPLPKNPKLLSSSPKRNVPTNQFHDTPSSKRNLPGNQLNDLPFYPAPYPSYFNHEPKVNRKIKIFGIVKSGQIYGGGLGHRTSPMWQGSFPANIPMPAFDRRSHHNESHSGHPHHPHRMDGGITWEATEIGTSRDGGYMEGNFFFPVYKHGRYHTYSIKMWTGQFSFHFTLPGDQSIQNIVKYWKKYTSKMYFHHFHSDWDLFNPGEHADEMRDKANKLDNGINRRSSNNGPIIILKGKQDKSTFSWSGKFILVFTV